jgi:hypothetical protein
MPDLNYTEALLSFHVRGSYSTEGTCLRIWSYSPIYISCDTAQDEL